MVMLTRMLGADLVMVRLRFGRLFVDLRKLQLRELHIVEEYQRDFRCMEGMERKMLHWLEEDSVPEHKLREAGMESGGMSEMPGPGPGFADNLGL